MEYRRLGNAGLKVSTVALGGWTTFGASIQDDDLARQIITTAYDGGVTPPGCSWMPRPRSASGRRPRVL